MGRPIELGTPRAPNETESSSDEEGWVAEGSDSDHEGEWQDPTGGALTAVFEAAEAGDVDELQEALGRLDVSIDTRVRSCCRRQLKGSCGQPQAAAGRGIG